MTGRQIVDAVYMTVEAPCPQTPDTHVMVWVTSHVRKTSGVERWPRPKPRPDGYMVLDKPGDEAYMLLLMEPDGRLGTVIWETQPSWTKDELHADVQRHIDGIFAGTIAQTSGNEGGSI